MNREQRLPGGCSLFREIKMMPVIALALFVLPFALTAAVLAEWTYRYFSEWRDALGTDGKAFEPAGAALLGWLPWLPVPFFHPPALLTLALAAPGAWVSLHALSDPANQPLRGFFVRILAMQLTMALWLLAINPVLHATHF